MGKQDHGTYRLDNIRITKAGVKKKGERMKVFMFFLLLVLAFLQTGRVKVGLNGITVWIYKAVVTDVTSWILLGYTVRLRAAAQPLQQRSEDETVKRAETERRAAAARHSVEG